MPEASKQSASRDEKSVASVAAIDTSRVGRQVASTIEAAEAAAWADLYAAAPRGFAESAGLGTRELGGALALSWAASGRRYFSRTIGLGVLAPATEEGVEAILDGYREAGIEMFLLQSMPHCRPAGYEAWLRERGLEAFDRQDRIVRGGEPPARSVPGSPDRELAVERVSAETADEWAEFLQRVYRLDTGRWLQALIGRARWHQYVAREDAEIVAARGMYLGASGIAWLGMDGPVPGIMSGDHEPDAAICARVVADGLARGARMFIADIEAPAEALDTPAYENFAALGFRRPYTRTHYARV